MSEKTLQELFKTMNNDVYNILDYYEKFMERLREQETESTSMIKSCGSQESDRQVLVCEKCEKTCLTSYRADAPDFCPNCGRKVVNHE